MRRIALAALVVTTSVLALVPAALARQDAPKAKAATVSVQLLSINDYHGNLEPPAGSSGRIGTTDAGGVEYLATHVKALRAQNPNTMFVGAGDMIGASPLLSALFHDEPSIESLNAAGLEVTSVGNHEFDEGPNELLRMQRGGCHPTDKCQDGDGFAGAKFRYLSANVERKVTSKQQADYRRKLAAFKKALRSCTSKGKGKAKGKAKACARLKAPKAPKTQTLLPATYVRNIGGVKVGFIGMTLEGTPEIVTPSAVSGLLFRDEAATANMYVAQLKKQKVETIVVLLHEGGFQTGGADYNGCAGISGPVVNIANAISDEVDVILSGHTHNAYNCTIGTKLVTSASSFGRLITDVDLEIDSGTGEVVSKVATNRIVTRDVAKDAAETQIIEKYRRISAPLANRVIGSITADVTRTTNAAGESALGDVIADAQLAATKDAAKGGAVVAFMNPGGIRADLTYAQISGGEQPGQVTYGESFTVQPFGNTLVVKTMTGAQIENVLEQQWTGTNASAPKVLQVSAGFTYTWDPTKPAGDRVDIASIRINGTPVVATQSYRVTMNSFLADGGDGFAAFREGTNTLGGEVDTDALETYFKANSPVPPGPRNRITRVG